MVRLMTKPRQIGKRPTGRVLTSFLIDAQMLAALKAAAAEREDSVGKVLREAAAEWLRRHEARKGARR